MGWCEGRSFEAWWGQVQHGQVMVVVLGEGMGVVGVKRTHQCWMGPPPCPARTMTRLRRARVWKGQLSVWVGLNQLLLCQAEMARNIEVLGCGHSGSEP